MVVAALLTLILATLVQATEPFEVALWPGEGRPVIESVASELELREQPFGSVKTVLKVAVVPGQRLQFDETRFRTTRPGQLQALGATNVTGRRLGARRALSVADYYSGKFPEGTVTLNAGDTVEYLQYRAEGTCFVRIAGVVFDAKPCPRGNRDEFRLLREPAVEWWVRLVSDDKPMGWLLLTGKTAKVVGREF